MNIVCPQCGFSRNVDDSRIKKRIVIATCPKCSCKFRIADSGFLEVLPSVSAENMTPINDAKNIDEDIRLAAAKAYENESKRFENEESENRHSNFGQQENIIKAFWQTIMLVMFSAPAFFKNLSPKASLKTPLIFYLVLCVIQIFVEQTWSQIFYSILSPGVSNDPQMEKMLEMLAPDTGITLTLLLRTGVMVAELYLFSFAMSLMYRLVAPEKASFSLLFQIIAYSAAPSILCIIPAIGSLAAFFWTIGCIAAGCKAALDIDWAKVFFGFLPIIFLFIPLLSRILG